MVLTFVFAAQQGSCLGWGDGTALGGRRNEVVVGIELGFGCEQNMIAPTPANELAELLKDEKVQNAAGGDLVVVVVRNAVPVEALEGL